MTYISLLVHQALVLLLLLQQTLTDQAALICTHKTAKWMPLLAGNVCAYECIMDLVSVESVGAE